MDRKITFHEQLSSEISQCLLCLAADVEGLIETLEKYLNLSDFASTYIWGSVNRNNKKKRS